MNIFLVTSPLQLLCAIEAKHQFKTSNNILIIRKEKSKSAKQQVEILLDKKEWDHIIYIGRKNKVWEIKKTHMKLKSINKTLSFKKFFYADYSAWRTNVILNNINIEQEIMFDDGVGTIREFHEKILPNLIVSRNKPSCDFLLKTLGLRAPREIYPRDNFSFFTFFNLPKNKFEINKNNLSILQNRLDTFNCFSKSSPVGFIGQGMVAEKGINLDYYEEIIKNIIKENKVGMIYFPHRTEKSFVKERLEKIEGLNYHQSSMPLELEIAHRNIQLSKMYSIASTASISLELLYPNIPIIDLYIPINFYENKEFGKNFHKVRELLNLNSIHLE